MMLKLLSFAVIALAGGVQAADIQLGDTNLLGATDGGNANLLLANGPYALTQAATLKSLSLYIGTAAGHLRLGIYTSGPNNDCKGGALQAQTASFTPGSNKWNTANVISQVALPVGNYCLAYEPSSNSLSFRKGLTTGISITYYPFTFGPMPAQFSSSPSTDQFHWSFYATLTPITAPTLSLSFNPANPSLPANAPAGTVVAAVVPSWSNGNPFTGTLSFGTPNFSDGGCFGFDGSRNLITACDLSGDGGTIQNITGVATQ